MQQAKATKNYQDFGLLAEKLSEDDFRVNMGDHKLVDGRQTAAAGGQSFAGLQSGQVSGLIQIESAYTIVRVNAHNPARRRPFAEVKNELKTNLKRSSTRSCARAWRSNCAPKPRSKKCNRRFVIGSLYPE